MYSIGLEIEFFTEEPLMMLPEVNTYSPLKSVVGYDGIGPLVKEIRLPPVYRTDKIVGILAAFVFAQEYINLCKREYQSLFQPSISLDGYEGINPTAGIHISVGGDFLKVKGLLFRLFLIGLLNENPIRLIRRITRVGTFRKHKERIEFRLLSSRDNLNNILKTAVLVL